jgi:hypothetical protein
MITLFLGIVFVYVLLFQVKGKTLNTQQTLPNQTWGNLTISIKSGENLQTLIPITQTAAFTGAGGTTSFTSPERLSWSQIQNPLLGVTSSSWGQKTWLIHILSGTNVFYGKIEVIEKLGIKYSYALIDTQNIYYINLGNPTYDFANITRNLGGSLYELKTEAEINQNKLFGTKITFINLPEYKDKKVVMIISWKGESWLVWVEYALYHKSKSYIKSLFIQ